MKRCPYCAEEIQDAAVLCRFCGRAQKSPGDDRDPLMRALAALVVFCAALAGAYAVSRSGTADELRAAVHQLTAPRDSLATLEAAEVTYRPPPPPPPPPPAVFDVADTDLPRRLQPGEYTFHRAELDDPRRCRLTGSVAVLAGGSHDVDVFVVDEDGLAAFQYGDEFRARLAERRTSSVSLDLELPGGGTYYLIVSNRFSAFTSKLVHLDRIRATCGGPDPTADYDPE